jgi:HlyD family secretion protein
VLKKACAGIGAFALLLAGCEPARAPVAYQGYVEAELVDIAAPLAGRLEELSVARGQSIARGAPLFRLDDAPERAGVAEAHARLQAARARVDNLLAARREPEVQALRAQAASARAASELTRLQLQQAERLFASGFVSQARLDEAQANHAANRARVAEAQAQILNASIAVGRAGEVAAAQAEIRAADAEVEQREWQLNQKSRSAPAAALVYETYYNTAEWVPAGTPVVSLLPPAHLKLRFFVPEAQIGTMTPGIRVQAHCSGCAQPIEAAVSYVSPRPEYTPPIIYSRETKAKLVFLVEARPEPALAARLNPGQPIEVRPADAAQKPSR